MTETPKRKKSSANAKKSSSSGRKPVPRPVSPESVLRDIGRVMQGKKFKNLQEANEYLATLVGPGLEQALREVPPPSPKEEAQELAFEAMEAESRQKALRLAKRALARDPDCVDALVLLADLEAKTTRTLVGRLQEAVAAGERSLGREFFKKNKGDFWGILETRPYMRARLWLAEELRNTGLIPEAVRHYEALIELNPTDNQGVRDLLLGCYLAVDDLTGAAKLLKQYDCDEMATFAWGRVLERYIAGDYLGAERALRRAREENSFVELFLTAEKKLPVDPPETYTFGSEEEAVLCIANLGPAWEAHKEAVFWVYDQLRLHKQAVN